MEIYGTAFSMHSAYELKFYAPFTQMFVLSVCAIEYITL